MKEKRSSFMIGLFVLFGTVIGFFLIFWLGVSKYYRTGNTYVTYFDESVQGLQVDSSVKYRGVDVGRVEEIAVAPDNRLIEVVMKINLSGDPEKSTVATLKSAGITGIVFIELNRMDPVQGDLSPSVPFPSEYPVIPSRPSEIRMFLTSADEIMEKIRKIDFDGIAGQIKALGKALESLLTGEGTSAVVANLRSLTARLDRVVSSLDAVAKTGLVEGSLGEAKRAMEEIRGLATAMKMELKNMKLAETSDKAGRLLGNLEERSRILGYDAEATSENLRRASETLDRLLERLYLRPSDMLFSRPPAGE